MTELLVGWTQNSITSVEFAELSWRRHDHLLRSISIMNRDLKEMNKTVARVGEYMAWNKLKAKMYTLNGVNKNILCME